MTSDCSVELPYLAKLITKQFTNVVLTDRRLKTSATDHYYTSGEMAPLYDLSTSKLSLVHIALCSDIRPCTLLGHGCFFRRSTRKTTFPSSVPFQRASLPGQPHCNPL